MRPSRLGEGAVLSNVQKTTETGKMKKSQGNILQRKEQDKSPEMELNKMEICYVPNRKFKITVVKMPTEGRRAMMNKVEI